jgi:hypothetical protein
MRWDDVSINLSKKDLSSISGIYYSGILCYQGLSTNLKEIERGNLRKTLTAYIPTEAYRV